jgi:hypothetical protein
MNDFRFGLEAEFLLADSTDFRPLWYKDVTFKALEPPHKKLMPFIVEGYSITDENFVPIDAYPKGIEIRTPVCRSIEETLTVYETLYGRVKRALGASGMVPVAISHHPTETKFVGPQNKRRHDFWLWAMEVMTTYGPDINVSFPKEISDRLFANTEDLEAKMNFYAPALASVSLASPFLKGKPWMIKGAMGKSFRTFKRSIVAPTIELHADENFRIEFKVFEMTKHSTTFRNYFLLTLALFLDEGLRGRSMKPERIYDLGAVARFGLSAEGMKERFFELFERAPKVLRDHGFDPAPLAQLRLDWTPADEMLEIFTRTQSINSVLQEFSYLNTLSGERI